MVSARGLVRTFGTTRALDGVDLDVPRGAVVGLLGPNGAGKTTAVRILTTLLRPDSGRASVAGLDVVRQAAQVRRVIGLTGQYASVDEDLTGRENLELFATLLDLSRRDGRRRAGDLLEEFGLTEAADRPARTYSGGMRRRLDLAASLIAHPRLIVLDEPTTGLDPARRDEMWRTVRRLVSGGATVLLTTQYLEEADALADRIAVMARGRIVAEGTPSTIKQVVGGQTLQVEPTDAARTDEVRAILARVTGHEPFEVRAGRIAVEVPDDSALAPTTAALAQAGISLAELALRLPTLDEAFLSLVGNDDGAAASAAPVTSPAPPLTNGVSA